MAESRTRITRKIKNPMLDLGQHPVGSMWPGLKSSVQLIQIKASTKRHPRLEVCPIRAIHMNSERLRRYVLEELAFDPRVDASGIGVSVENRIVSLTGHVHSATDKSAAVDAVKRLKGVRGIVVDIDVRPAAEFKIEDEEIAKRAATVLAWNRSVPRDSVKVTVEGGYVTISGIVDWQFQKVVVEEDLRRLAGVTGIRNELAIRSASQKRDIHNSIKEAMRRLADVHSSQITQQSVI